MAPCKHVSVTSDLEARHTCIQTSRPVLHRYSNVAKTRRFDCRCRPWAERVSTSRPTTEVVRITNVNSNAPYNVSPRRDQSAHPGFSESEYGSGSRAL